MLDNSVEGIQFIESLSVLLEDLRDIERLVNPELTTKVKLLLALEMKGQRREEEEILLEL